ncbi:hypothetical protein [Duganella caerulea]|uniref:hypothetical protein n=1 Tax=Duganella caerulea TaxID=2885762 RepID=UPI00403794C4
MVEFRECGSAATGKGTAAPARSITINAINRITAGYSTTAHSFEITMRILNILLSCALVISCNLVSAHEAPPKKCAYDRARLLALDENQFDQDMSGGWRQLSSIPGCARVAADVLHDYREAHHIESSLLFWHEAQVRAQDGQYPEAIALMKRAYKTPEEDKAGWNLYVDATVAFLSRDRAALGQVKSKLAAVPPPLGADIPPVVNGYMELDFADGSKKKLRWPINIEVVEGLENCFDKPYAEAYGDACRENKH